MGLNPDKAALLALANRRLKDSGNYLNAPEAAADVGGLLGPPLYPPVTSTMRRDWLLPLPTRILKSQRDDESP